MSVDQKQVPQAQQPVGLGMPSERDQVLGFLFSSCDQKNNVIKGLQERIQLLEQTITTLQEQLKVANATIAEQNQVLSPAKKDAPSAPVAPVS